MSETMTVWDKVKKPPTSALKQIEAGRMKGKSNIDPQWRLQIMTEVFGQCGVGWKFSIDRLWREDGAGGEAMAMALVSVYTKQGDQWSDPVPGIGGNMLVVNEKNGPHTDDEGYKKAVTDALSVALKALGVAADVYMGKFDGSKWRAESTEAKPILVGSGPDVVVRGGKHDGRKLILLTIDELKDLWVQLERDEDKKRCAEEGKLKKVPNPPEGK